MKRKNKKNTNNNQINDINNKALSMGMSYGEYVAMQYMHQKQDEHKPQPEKRGDK